MLLSFALFLGTDGLEPRVASCSHAPAQAANKPPDAHAFFFDYISLEDTGRPGLTLFRLAGQDQPGGMAMEELCRLQHSLFVAWLDTLKVMAEDALDVALAAIPNKLWSPEFARQGETVSSIQIQCVHS